MRCRHMCISYFSCTPENCHIPVRRVQSNMLCYCEYIVADFVFGICVSD